MVRQDASVISPASRVSIVVGVDGSGRTHRLHQLARAAAGAVRIEPPVTTVDVTTFDGRLVVVDDPHALAPDQLVALTAAARDGVPMLIGRRPTIESAELAALDEAVGRQGSVEQLAALGPADCAALVGGGDGVALAAATGGLPALVVAVGPQAPAAATPAVIARVQRRLARHADPVVQLARVLALGLELTDAVLAAATDLPEASLAASLRALRDEGLLQPSGETMLPVVAAAVLADLPAAQRRRVHDDLARALIAQGGDIAITAGQLRAARAHPPAAAPVYLSMADRLRFTDPTAATAWYDDAADAGADPALVAVGRAEAAAQLGLVVDTDAAPAVAAVAARVSLVDGAVQAHDGRVDRSADTLLATDPPGPVLAVPGLVATGRLGDAQSAAAAAGPAAVRLLAEAALVAARDPAAAVALLIEAAELAERSVPPVVLPDTPHALGALAAAVSGDVAAAEHLLQRAIMAGAGGPGAQDRHRLLLAFVRLRAGRYDTAVAELARLAGASLRGRDRLLYAALAAGVARRSGDVAKLRDAWAEVETVLARRTVDLFTTEAIEELAVAATRLRRQAKVEPLLSTLDGIVTRLGHPATWKVAVGWIRVQTAVASDAGDNAAAAWPAAGAPDEWPAAAGARQLAQLEAARLWTEVLAGQVDVDRVLAAGERLAEVELPWEGSRLVGQAAIRTSDPAAARRLLERARDLSSAEVVAAEGRAEGQGGLSEREVEVARMVLAGSTHREIGSRLFISPKTVEHHVARIRTKLGVTTRADFVAALRELLGDA